MFRLENLNDVRQEMTAEANRDIAADSWYKSGRLNSTGRQAYPSALLTAATNGTPESFAAQFGMRNFNAQEEKRKPNGGTTMANVPVNANVTLCEGEFNRYYMRGVCLRALALGQKTVVAYRARHSDNPRPESEAMVGREFDAQQLLDELRKTHIVDNALGLPPGPNSGMSVKLKS